MNLDLGLHECMLTQNHREGREVNMELAEQGWEKLLDERSLAEGGRKVSSPMLLHRT